MSVRSITCFQKAKRETSTTVVCPQDFSFLSFQQMALRDLDQSEESEYSQGGFCSKGHPLGKNLRGFVVNGISQNEKKVKIRQQLEAT